MASHFKKHMGSKVAAIGEFDAFGAAIGASLNDPFAILCVWMVEHRDHALVHHLGQYRHSIKCHLSCSLSVGFAGWFSGLARSSEIRLRPHETLRAEPLAEASDPASS